MIDPRLITDSFAASVGRSPDVESFMIVRRLYVRTRRRGVIRRLWLAARGLPRRLSSLRAGAPGAYPAPGRVVQRGHVPIAQIQGSEGREGDFDRHFVPLQSHTRERWLSVALAWYRCQPLPPVQLVAVGDVYYVRDGHHRISVARAFGADSVDAEVERWQPGAPAEAPAGATAGLLPQM